MRSAHPTEVNVSALAPRPNDNALDLFPELLPPIVAAYWPTRGTRADEALQAPLTAPQNQADYWRGWRRAAYVKGLEYDGWRFVKRDILRPACRRPITEYSVDRSDPGTAAALASRQKGTIDLTLAGLLAFAAVCTLMLLWVPA